MGACASVPRAMRGEFTSAPAPEPAKEETPAAAASAETTVEKESKVEEVTEKKAEGGDDKKEEIKADTSAADNTQSLGTLLVEGEAPKEAESAQSKVEKNESKAAEVLPVSEPAASKPEEKTTTVTPPAPAAAEVAAKVEEKKTEVAEKK